MLEGSGRGAACLNSDRLIEKSASYPDAKRASRASGLRMLKVREYSHPGICGGVTILTAHGSIAKQGLMVLERVTGYRGIEADFCTKWEIFQLDVALILFGFDA